MSLSTVVCLLLIFLATNTERSISVDTTIASASQSFSHGYYLETISGSISGLSGYASDGSPAYHGLLNNPEDIFLDENSNKLYIADSSNNRIRSISPLHKDGSRMYDHDAATIRTEVGSGDLGYDTLETDALKARFFRPYGVAVDSHGNIFVADTGNNCIRLTIKSTGKVRTIAGNTSMGYAGDGMAPSSDGIDVAMLHTPRGIAIRETYFTNESHLTQVYFSDTRNNRVRMITLEVNIHEDIYNAINITTVAGNGFKPTAVTHAVESGVPATATWLNEPSGVVLDKGGNLYIADSANSIIRYVWYEHCNSMCGTIYTVAGGGNRDVPVDGNWINATDVHIGYPEAIAVDMSNRVYIASSTTNQILMLNMLDGMLKAIAGIGSSPGGYNLEEGDGVKVKLNIPIGLAVDSTGYQLYVADNQNQRIRKLSKHLCLPGYFSPSGSAEIIETRNGREYGCYKCPPNSVNVSDTAMGATTCLCNVGFFQTGSGPYMFCTPCPDGSNTTAYGSYSCACNAGYFHSPNDSHYDVVNGVGKISSLDNYTCSKCPYRSNSHDINAATCDCQQGYGNVGYGNSLYCDYCLPRRYDENTHTCQTCPYPWVSSVDTSLTYGMESKTCSHIDIQFSDRSIRIQLWVCLVAYIFGLASIQDREDDIRIKPIFPWVGFFLYTIIPVADFISDTVYLTTNEFANIWIFLVTLAFLLLSISFFFRFLHKKKVPACLLYKIIPERYLDGIKNYESYSDRLTAIMGVTLYYLGSLYLVPWLVFGAFLYMTKLFGIIPIQRMWWIGFAGQDPLRNTDKTIDWHYLNESITSEIMFEAIPQLILQLINNILLGKPWSGVGYVSITTSILLILFYAVMVHIIDKKKLAKQFEDMGINIGPADATEIEITMLPHPAAKIDPGNQNENANVENRKALTGLKWKSPLHDDGEEEDDDRQTAGLLASGKSGSVRDEAYLEQLKSREKDEQENAQRRENEALDPTWNGGIDFIDDVDIL